MSESAFAERIVHNLLDTDFYKLTMMQGVLHNYPDADVEWEFRCRNGEDLRPYLGEIRNQLERLADLTLDDGQLAFLERISFLKPDFLRFLRLFRFNLRYVHVGIENDQLFLRLKGPWLHVILFEVPLLAIISEVRNRNLHPHMRLAEARDQLYRKFDWLRAHASDDELAELQVADFGTRFYAFPAACRRKWQGCCATTSPAVLSAPATSTWHGNWISSRWAPWPTSGSWPTSSSAHG